MNERSEMVSSGKTKLVGEFADELRGNAGATGSRTSILSKAGAGIGQLLALHAVGSASPPPPAPTAPGAPTGLSATATSGAVALSWAPPSDDGGAPITDYRIYRSTTAGTETLLTGVGNVTSFQDTNLTNGVRYFYVVAAVNSVGEGAKSNEASAIPSTATAPAPPTGLTAVPAKPRGISLTWTAPSNGGSVITGYEVWRGTAPGAETKLTTSNVTGTRYKDTTAISGVNYWYYVKAVNVVGISDASPEVSAVAR